MHGLIQRPGQRLGNRFGSCFGRLARALLGVLLAGCGAGEPPLNVLLVTLDTTRPDRLGCYGHRGASTRAIDELASEGVRFANVRATAGLTPMSHASILTGLNNYRHGMRVFYSTEHSHRLKPECETLPELLRERGWRTAAFVSSYPVSEVYGLDQGFEVFETGLDVESLDLTRQQRHEELWHEGEAISTQRRGDVTTTQALEWLRALGNEPWCVWMHYFDAHDFSLVPPLDFAREFGIEAYPKRVPSTDYEWRDRMYDPELAFIDRQLARVLDWLEESGQAARTVVVVTADHGQGLLDGLERHGWGNHRLLYDWSIRVPLLLRYPGCPRGEVVEEQVRTIDILPTLLELLDVPAPATEGASLLALARGEKEAEPRIAYADALNLFDAHSPKARLPASSYDNLFVATDGRWKLIHHREKPQHDELFDLASDPGELHDVASAHPEQRQRLLRYLEQRAPWDVERPGAETGPGPDAGALHSLGYGGEGDEQDRGEGARQDGEEGG